MSLDADVGNNLNDGIKDIFEGAAGNTFAVEIFIEGLQTPIIGVQIRFEPWDYSLLQVRGLTLAGDNTTLVTGSEFAGAIVAVTGSLDLGDNGYFGIAK